MTQPAAYKPDAHGAHIVPFAHRRTVAVDASNRRIQRPTIAFQSREIETVVRTAKRYARSSAAVLVTGESGTGKELFSRLLHTESRRSTGPFVAVNCAALSETLFESEMFGHARGAFTGAIDGQPGLFEIANGGTLLLDEISEIPLASQAKLLRVIEQQEVQRVGSRKVRPVDVRIVATSNRDLEEAAKEGRFRVDLYHRLNVLRLRIPPLRQRRTDIPLLVSHFLERYKGESESGLSGVEPDAMKRLSAYHWPGNVRELRNVIHRACVLCAAQRIDEACLVELDNASENDASTGHDDAQWRRFDGLELSEIERQVILRCLKRHGGNKTSAAAELGITSRTLRNKLERYRLDSTAHGD